MIKLFKQNKLTVLLSLCLLALIAMGASSKVSSLRLELEVGDTFGIRMRDTNDVVRYQLDTDGSTNIYNSSGTKVAGVDGAGKPEQSWKDKYLVMNTMAEARAQSSDYSLYLIDTTNYVGNTGGGIGGVSHFFPVGSAAMDGFRVNYTNISGASEIMIIPANDIILSNGITDWVIDETGTTGISGTSIHDGPSAGAGVFTYNMINVAQESIEYVYVYGDSHGGTWYQVGSEN